jgi:hypothetical protein
VTPPNESKGTLRATPLPTASDKSSGGRIHFEQGGVVIASWRNVGVIFWGSQATIEAVRAIGAMGAELLKAHGQLSMVQVIPDNVPMPTDDARAALLKLTSIATPNMASAVFVLSGDGFWASAMRSFLTNVHYGRQRPFAPRICATVEEAAAWLPGVHTPRTAVYVDSTALLEVLNACAARAKHST